VSSGIAGDEQAKYLKAVASKLSEKEKYVVLEMDEIHVNASYTYKGGIITGAAINNTHESDVLGC
jgi:hypothetical protein